LNARWPLKPSTYGYEPPVTDANKANEQYTKNVRLRYHIGYIGSGKPCDIAEMHITLSQETDTLRVYVVPSITLTLSVTNSQAPSAKLHRMYVNSTGVKREGNLREGTCVPKRLLHTEIGVSTAIMGSRKVPHFLDACGNRRISGS
jgi:hypothetical protein